MSNDQSPQALPFPPQAPGYPGYPAYPTYPSSPAQPMHLWDYWAIVMKRIWLVLLFVIASATVAWLITKSQEPQYRATATIEIRPPTVTAGDASFAPVILSDDRYLETQLDKLRMPDVLEAAVKREELTRRAEFDKKTAPEILRMALGRVEVSRRRDKYLIDVSVTGTNQRTLHHIANALVNEFCAMQVSDSQKRREAKRAEIDARIQKLASDIQIEQSEKRVTLDLANMNEQSFEYELKFQQTERETYAKERDEVRTQLIRDEPIAQAFEAAMKAGGDTALEDLAKLPQVQLHPLVRAIQERLAVLEEERQALVRDAYDVSHPNFQAWTRENERALSERRRAIQGYVEGFMLDYRGRQQAVTRLTEMVDRATAKLQNLQLLKNKVDASNDRIQAKDRDRAAAQEEANLLLQASQPLQVPDSVVVSSQAREPMTPYAPNPRTNMIFGLVIGVVGGLGLAFLLDYLDDTVRTKDELAKVADVPLLGIVPRIDGGSDTGKKDLFAHSEPKSTISEAYRGVRTALTLSPNASRQKVLLLTSAGPREGKTTTSINLATVLSYSGGRTLIIDADLRKPRIHKSFDLPNMRGLTNAIIVGDDPMQYVQRTVCEGVDLLPSGPIPPNPSELLGHPRMKEILTTFRGKYEYIIIDTPPIGAVTDAAVLATVVDGVILVVHAGKTRRQIVSRGLEQLRYIHANIVGVILNNLHVGRIRYNPGYYQYYYYYSHYGAEDAPPETKKPAKS